MGNRLRHFEPGIIYFITIRCLQQRYFFRPGKDVNTIIANVLAYAADKFDVDIYAFVFMSNHFHLMVGSHSCQIQKFMQLLDTELAKQLNAHWGRSGSFFESRYKCSPILDDDELLNKLRYTVCNPCESNLVAHPKFWPGLSSWDLHESATPLVGQRVNKKEYWRLRRKDIDHAEAERRAMVDYELEMAKLPMWKDLSDEAYNQKVLEELRDHAEHLAEHRKSGCVGVDKILEQNWYDRPKDSESSPCPLCHTTDPKLREEYTTTYWEVRDLYKQAADKWRDGKTDLEFPNGTIPPGHRECVGAPEPREEDLA